MDQSESFLENIKKFLDYHDYRSYESTRNWLLANEYEWQNNFNLIANEDLHNLKDQARYDIELRQILAKYIFDINWIISDIVFDRSRKSDAIAWIRDHQNELKKYQNDVDQASFLYYNKTIRSNDEVRPYLRAFFFQPSWAIYELVYGDPFEKNKSLEWLKSNEIIWKKDIDLLELPEFVKDAFTVPIAWTFFESSLPLLTNYSKIFNKTCSIAENNTIQAKESILLLFSILPNKSEAWTELVVNIVPYLNECSWNGKYRRRPSNVLIKEQESWILSMLSTIFLQHENKIEGFESFFELNRITSAKARYNSIYFALKIFDQIPENQQYLAWQIIIKSIKMDNPFIEIKYQTATLLNSFFCLIPLVDREKAWNDIEELLQENDNILVAKLIDGIGDIIPLIPEERILPLLDILHNLVDDKNSEIRSCVAESLGKFYCNVSSNHQEKIYSDLSNLIDDSEHVVSASAKYSLGTINIFIATQSENIEGFQEHLDHAIKYFESSLGSAEFFNQARFCYPFYKAYWNIAFTDTNDTQEIEQFLTEAKSAQGNSETRKTLVKAVNSLAKAIKSARQNRDFESLKSHFNSYRKYCESAVSLLKNTELHAPMATQILLKGLPVIDKKIKKIISEIQDEAKNICKKTKGTNKELFGQKTHELAQNLSQLNAGQIPDGLNQLVDLIEENFCGQLIVQDRKKVCQLIQETKIESHLHLKLEKIKSIISAIGEKLLNLTDIHLGDRIKNTVKIATVQLNFQLTLTFPPTLIEKDTVKEKIFRCLNLAYENNVDLILFPELCTKKSWIDDIKNQFPEIMIVFGSCYDGDENVANILYDSKIVGIQKKITPSALEDPTITGVGMKSGPKNINIFWSHIGEFSILICRDFGAFHNDISGRASLVLVPSYNHAITRFYENAHVHVNNSPSYIVISNSSKYGGTSIFGQMNKSYFPQLIEKKYKEPNDFTYNLCSIRKDLEGMILANFNIVNKTPQILSPMNPGEENKTVTHINILPIS